MFLDCFLYLYIYKIVLHIGLQQIIIIKITLLYYVSNPQEEKKTKKHDKGSRSQIHLFQNPVLLWILFCDQL